MGSNKDQEVPLSRQKSLPAPDIKTEFVGFVTRMINKYGSKKTALACNIFSQEGEKRGDRVVYHRDYKLLGMSIHPVAVSLLLIHSCLKLNGFNTMVIIYISLVMQYLFMVCYSISNHRGSLWRRSQMFINPILDSSEDPEVTMLTQNSVSDQNIAKEFEKFGARMKKTYEEETPAATMKSFAQGAQEEGEFNTEERSCFEKAIHLTLLSVIIFLVFFMWLLQEGYDFPPIAYFSIFFHFLALFYHGVNIYHKRYSKLFSPPTYSIVIFIIISAFATHLLTFYFSWVPVQHSQ